MLVKSKMAEDHTKPLEQMFNILRKYQMKLNLIKCAVRVRSGKFLGFMVKQRGIEAKPKKIRALLEMSSPRKPKKVMCLTGRVALLSRFISRATDHCALFFNMLKGSKKFQWNDKCE